MLFLVYVLYPIELEDISYVITLPTNAHHGPAWPTTAHSIALFGPLQPTTSYNGLLRPTTAYYSLLQPTKPTNIYTMISNLQINRVEYKNLYTKKSFI